MYKLQPVAGVLSVIKTIIQNLRIKKVQGISGFGRFFVFRIPSNT